MRTEYQLRTTRESIRRVHRYAARTGVYAPRDTYEELRRRELTLGSDLDLIRMELRERRKEETAIRLAEHEARKTAIDPFLQNFKDAARVLLPVETYRALIQEARARLEEQLESVQPAKPVELTLERRIEDLNLLDDTGA